MSEVEQMSESEEIKRRKAEAQKHFNIIKRSQLNASVSSLRIGYHAYRLKVEGLFGALGFQNESEAREAAGVGQSTWYENIRLAEAFKDVDEERFVAMKQANAKALANLPESQRTSTEWLRMAEVEKIEEFAVKCDQAMNGKTKASDGKEPSTSTMKLVMPASRKAVIEGGIRQFAEAHGLSADDPGKVVELMAVETTGSQTLLGSITTTLQRIAGLREFMKSGVSADEVLGRVEKELDDMVLDFQSALEQAAQRKVA